MLFAGRVVARSQTRRARDDPRSRQRNDTNGDDIGVDDIEEARSPTSVTESHYVVMEIKHFEHDRQHEAWRHEKERRQGFPPKPQCCHEAAEANIDVEPIARERHNVQEKQLDGLIW